MRRAPTLDDLFRSEVPSEPALSPDGSLVAYVLTTVSREHDRDERAIWTVDAATSRRRWISAGHDDRGPVWSPAGTLAYLGTADDGSAIHVFDPVTGRTEVVHERAESLSDLAWSPDGGRIAFLANVPLLAGAAPAAPGTPVSTTRLTHRRDGVGLVGDLRWHVHVLDVAAGTTRRLTQGDWDAAHPAWSPDGRELLITADLGDEADLRPSPQLFRLDATGAGSSTSAELRRLTSFSGSAGPGVWTTDGGAVVAVGTRGRGARNAGLFRCAPDREPVPLTDGLDRMVMQGETAYPGARPVVTPDDHVLFCARDLGHTSLYVLDSSGGDEGQEPRLVPMPEGSVVSGLSVATSAPWAATVVSSRESFGEVTLVDHRTGELRTLTNHFATAYDDVAWLQPQLREFTVADGTAVQGVLLRDPATEGPSPLLLDIHGGPHNSWSSALDQAHLYHQVLAAEGWTILLLNPRGSDGRDEAFLRAAVGSWGFADEGDFLAPIEQLVAEGLVDSARVSVCGYSYGGYAVCHLTARTDRFASAVAGGVICDLRSFAGGSDMGHEYATDEFGGEQAVHARTLVSPLDLVDRVTTPTLVLHGEHDDRCPVGQAEQWFTALRERGVESELVLYPDASHVFIVTGRPSYRLDFNQRTHDWVTRHAARATRSRRPGAHGAAEHWSQRLSLLADRHDVPGAVLGVLDLRAPGPEQTIVAAHGWLNVDTRQPVSARSRFQIGSITKVWTATLAMQLAEEGVLDLDRPVSAYLPGLDLGSDEHTRDVTMRHLLSHTSGLDGDLFIDTGRGDDHLSRYVSEVLSAHRPTNPPGSFFSYCNSGFSLAGLVVERLAGDTWDEVLRRRLVEPLRLADTGTLPEGALLGEVAVGHLRHGDEAPRPTPTWHLPRSGAPAGAVWASAADVLRFARLHLRGGVLEGERLLSEKSVVAMQDPVVRVPVDHFGADAWGLGWMTKEWSGRQVFGHDGGTIGQTAFLRVVPDAGVAAVLLINGGDAYGVYRDLLGEVLLEVAEVALPLRPEPDPSWRVTEADLVWAGRYGRELQEVEVAGTLGDADGLRFTVSVQAEFADLLGAPQTRELRLRSVGKPGAYVFRVPGTDHWSSVGFFDHAGVAYVHEGLRASPRR